MIELIPLDVKYSGNHGELLGVKGRVDIAIFRVPPNSLTPYDVAQTMQSLVNQGVITNCVLDLEGYSHDWKASRIEAFAYLAERRGLRDSYIKLDTREINHKSLGIPKGPRGSDRVKKIQERLNGKIIGATVDEVVERISTREAAGFLL